ncbi:MAG TPA: TIGR03009 domain-containing protein [Gemmataceae bacterium]|jgi:TIGR03009 family protein|nr:TIGR03009 domain-containing protein [Gemmataceae bacterium]
MRRYGQALAVALLTALAASAQQTAPPTPPPAAAPAPAKLDEYLRRWEQEMAKVETLAAQLNRTDKDKTFDRTVKLTGYAQYLRAGKGPTALNLAMLEMRPEGKNEIAEKVICTGTFLYQFKPAEKVIQAVELPRPKPGVVADDNMLSFLLGMKAEDAKRRYDLKLAKEDQFYIYVDVAPRDPKDKVEFQRARIVLNKDSFLPRQLWFENPNNSEVTWDIPRVQTGVPLKREAFDAPQAPPGWKLVPVARQDVPPRVARPNN